eukprot:m.145260 g.145260  ORF g.145260 m.145260 type:complete len:119 (+) comp23065_c0_seq2:435-791(+)
MAVLAQGAEAKVYIDRFLGRDVIVKERFPKRYRHPELDAKLTKQRILGEVRAIARCKDVGVATPSIFFVDLSGGKIFMECVASSVAPQCSPCLPCCTGVVMRAAVLCGLHWQVSTRTL